MANMAILSLVLYEFPGSEDAAAFHNLMQREAPGSFGSWETISGCGDMAVQTMDEWTGFALSARGRWVIQMIMQYPFTMFITEYDNSYSPDIRERPWNKPGRRSWGLWPACCGRPTAVFPARRLRAGTARMMAL